MAATFKEAEQTLKNWESKQKLYSKSHRSGNDDALFGDMGFYTARQEKAYINRQVKLYKKILENWPAEADHFEWTFIGSWKYTGPDGFKATGNEYM